MTSVLRSTVDRLDRPSAYYNSRVSSFYYVLLGLYRLCCCELTHVELEQNKRRRTDHGRDNKDGEAEVNVPVEESLEDPLRNATTIYVGNL